MNNLWIKLVGISAFSLPILSGPAIAQDTNASFVPPTRLESFATNIGSVIIRGSADAGAVTANNGAIALKCREVTDTRSGRREVGISMDLDHAPELRETRYIDYDELEPLIEAIKYLNKVDWSITSLNGFDAAITTKSGFRVSAFSSRRSSAIEFAVRTAGSGNPAILLSRDQMAELRGLLEQARTKLDAIRAK